MKQIIDLLNGLKASKLDDTDSEELMNLLERLAKLNSKRNILVHGHWTLEANVYRRRNDAVLEVQFLRETTPPDPKIATLISNPGNQKERVKYVFTIKRIIGTTRDTNALAGDFGKFLRRMKVAIGDHK